MTNKPNAKFYTLSLHDALPIFLLDSFPGRLVPRVVKVANAHALNARHVKRCLKQLATSYACANGGEPYRVAGRNCAGGRGQRNRLQNGNICGCACRHGACAHTDKLATSE